MKLFWGVILVLAVSTLAAGEMRISDNADVGSGAANDLNTWSEGGLNGHWLAVGQPNLCNRNDKVIFKFPLAQWIEAGKISRAVLRFKVAADKRNDRTENLYLEHFTVEKPFLNAMCLISPETVQVGKAFHLTAGQERNVSFDVTDMLNVDLYNGFCFCTFRVASKTAEEEGAATNGVVDSSSIVKDSIILDFEL